MTIYHPIKTKRKTQGFHDNDACIDHSTGNVVGKQNGSCPAGYVDFYKSIGMRAHGGEDWAAWHGEPLYFNVDLDTKWYARDASDLQGGLGVDIFSRSRVLIPELPKQAGSEAKVEWSRHSRKMYVKFRYWHLLEGDKDKSVELGEQIGTCDNTGASSGDHLHFSMKFVDEHGRTLDKDNGYYGGINMREVFDSDSRFVLDVLKKERTLTREQKIEELKQRIRTLINLVLEKIKNTLLGKK